MRAMAAGIALAILTNSAFSIEKMECGGTEPFWDAKLADGRVTFKLGSPRIYLAPMYSPASGMHPDFVMSVRAKRGKSNLTAFVVNEAQKVVADKDGAAAADPYRAYCSDGMSGRRFPFSIHLIVDGSAYTGCCWTATAPPVGQS